MGAVLRRRTMDLSLMDHDYAAGSPGSWRDPGSWVCSTLMSSAKSLRRLVGRRLVVSRRSGCGSRLRGGACRWVVARPRVVRHRVMVGRRVDDGCGAA